MGRNIFIREELNNEKVLIIGITGEDGFYLVELLFEKGYELYRIIRRASVFSTVRIEHLKYDINLFLRGFKKKNTSRSLRRKFTFLKNYIETKKAFGKKVILY